MQGLQKDQVIDIKQIDINVKLELNNVKLGNLIVDHAPLKELKQTIRDIIILILQEIIITPQVYSEVITLSLVIIIIITLPIIEVIIL